MFSTAIYSLLTRRCGVSRWETMSLQKKFVLPPTPRVLRDAKQPWAATVPVCSLPAQRRRAAAAFPPTAPRAGELPQRFRCRPLARPQAGSLARDSRH